ncbi:4Fe-4S_dicluster domain-containing protein [Hexamita inflata]|uniref:4Fe-4S dicluster domain-containing protein n=1 Tax=Hexamita inflata TaxID=28002 RepID=A0AA86QE70_9EUKA|nr:4Fe-4S dicluster domain-containing protein [Hexamita inflata]CAI9953327.1 4Fe-4S dicluster domain-containing protein [Hexamita inflata]CAI9954607.1 4Fe-4S dicluster domain-containing protein [Hexamita inflata]
MTSNKYITIDQKACVGCGGCITACPHDALEFNAEGKSSIKLTNMCDGGHECVVFCPIGVLTKNKQYGPNYGVDNIDLKDKVDQIVDC